MFCPRHKSELVKIRLDVYGCSDCGYSWLIKGYPKRIPRGKMEISSFHCPKCQDKINKNYLDSYSCESCGIVWMIHAYRNEKYRARKILDSSIMDKIKAQDNELFGARAHEGSR